MEICTNNLFFIVCDFYLRLTESEIALYLSRLIGYGELHMYGRKYSRKTIIRSSFINRLR